MNLIQISKYSLVQDLSNDTPSACITVIGHDLIEKFAIFAHQLAPMYFKVKSEVVLLQKIKSIMYRIDVQSFILLSKSAHYNCLAAILIGGIACLLFVFIHLLKRLIEVLFCLQWID